MKLCVYYFFCVVVLIGLVVVVGFVVGVVYVQLLVMMYGIMDVGIEFMNYVVL